MKNLILNIDPIAISIGPINIYWYGIAYMMGMILGLFYAKKIVSYQKNSCDLNITKEDIDEIFLWIVFGIILGARFGYIFDYITKPFSPKELVLRINSILKRSKVNKILNPEIFFGDYVLNIETRDFSKSGKRIYLTEKELNLLILLAESPGQPLSREDLAGLDEPGRAVDVGINRLRKKIEDDPTMPIWLQTVRGKGYILRPN